MPVEVRILLVEDQAVIALVIENLLESEGYQVSTFANGLLAWEHLQTSNIVYDVALLDRKLPDMDGLELLSLMKGHQALSKIPVIFETGQDDKDSVRESLAKGAYYYLTKPIQPDLLLAVVKAALEQSRGIREMQERVRLAERPIELLRQGCFHFHSLDEARLLAHYLANACPRPERVILGLQELLINAVEHGNLGISYQEKSTLLLADTWEQEVDYRLQLDDNKEKYVEVLFQRQPANILFTITDQGQGFAWQEYLQFSPERAFDIHGRGIALANKLSFDALSYQGIGNRVVVSINTDSL